MRGVLGSLISAQSFCCSQRAPVGITTRILIGGPTFTLLACAASIRRLTALTAPLTLPGFQISGRVATSFCTAGFGDRMKHGIAPSNLHEAVGWATILPSLIVNSFANAST